ncbi:unnamed protein product, partial [Lymnaea stagnalis]
MLAGINEFISNLTALPSCVWDPSTRIEPPAKIPSQDFRRSTKKALEENQKLVEEAIAGHDDEDPQLKRTGR